MVLSEGKNKQITVVQNHASLMKVCSKWEDTILLPLKGERSPPEIDTGHKGQLAFWQAPGPSEHLQSAPAYICNQRNHKIQLHNHIWPQRIFRKHSGRWRPVSFSLGAHFYWSVFLNYLGFSSPSDFIGIFFSTIYFYATYKLFWVLD